MGNLGRPHTPLFLSGAISSATSPLRKSFADSGCLSPVTPRRVSRHGGEDSGSSPGLFVQTETASRYTSYSNSTYLPTPGHFQIATKNNGLEIIEEDDYHLDSDSRSSITLVSPETDAQALPTTPFLYPTQDGAYINPEEGKLGTFSAINIIIGKTVGVGIYSVPSSIFAGVGSVGMSILMWVLGALISFCGLAVYLDLGTGIPKSGGERVYLERIFRRPRMLATCMFMAYVVLLGFSTPNCIVLGEYVVYALGIEVNRWNVRCIAVAVITAICIIHARYQKVGLQIINALGIGKMLILVFVLVGGVAGMVMGVGNPTSIITRRRFGEPTELHLPGVMLSTAQRNFSNIWAGSSTQPYDYATALLKVLYCFRGYSTANQVMSQLSQPTRTLRVAAPVALSLVSAGYILANVAYFLAVEKEDFRSSGVVVAGHFFRNVFGDVVGERVLPCFVIVSAFGNIAATSFAQARVNQELGKDGLLPFAHFFSQEGLHGTASRGLLLHWLVSVLVIVVPPPGQIYNFLVDIGGYPVSVISVAISIGLLRLQSSSSENWNSSFRASKLYILIFLFSNCFLLVLPWIKPKDGLGDDGRFPYYAYPATALLILGSGALYWIYWANLLPRLFGQRGLRQGQGQSTPWWMKHHKERASDASELVVRRWRRKGKLSSDESTAAMGLLSESSDEADIDDCRGTNRQSENGQFRQEGTKLAEDGSSHPQDLRRRAPCGCLLK